MSGRPWCLCAAVGLASIAAVSSAVAQLAPIPADPRIDPSTGRLIARFAPDRPFDHLHMRLEIDLPDMGKHYLTARQNLTLQAIGEPRSVVTLDCAGPKVSAASVAGVACAVSQDDKTLTIRLPRAVMPGERIDLSIAYDLDFGKNKGEGLTWSTPRDDREGAFWQNAQIHSQGQSQHNSNWFPCHDFPNERVTTELIVTVADGFEVLSNGRLVEKAAAGDGRTRWHWLQDKRHPYYLVSLVVGHFSVFDIGGPDSARPGIPMPVYVPDGREEIAKELLQETAAMMAFFEELLDEPYPWDQYAQSVVRDFAAGGMENTSATTLTLGALRGRAGSMDDLIAHELIHQWFGDLITCRTWEHLWLNEGWATFGEALWAEHVGGRESPEKAREMYLRQIRQMVRQQRFMNRAVAPEFTAMATVRYGNPDELFIRPDDVYSKGGIVLHMLRTTLGDDAFFRGVRLYIDRYKDGLVETQDFRRVMEEVSGRSLERFFDQWVFRPGVPRLELDYAFEGGTLTVKVEQMQTVDRFNPAFVFDLPLVVEMAGGGKRTIVVPVDSKTAQASFAMDNAPTRIVVDPELTVFAANRVRTPLPGGEEPAGREPAENAAEAAEGAGAS